MIGAIRASTDLHRVKKKMNNASVVNMARFY